MHKGQIALGLGAIVLVLLLYFAGKTASKTHTKTTVNTTVSAISIDDYITEQTVKLLAAEKEQINSISTALKATDPKDTATLNKLYLQSAEFWKNMGNKAIASYYLYEFSNVAATKEAYNNAGDGLIDAYKDHADSVISNNLITFALRSYENAVKIDSSDVELQIKLADVYVQGSQEPMKGIGILRELESKHPKNISVLLALGRMSIQSGQYDKAKERFKSVLTIEPQNTESLYFLAITEAELGHKSEAIRLFEMCKLLVNNKDFNKEIDDIVKNLK